MALTPAQVAQAAKDHADDQYGGAATVVCKFTKPQLQAAAQAIDDWIEANQASFNTALPQPFRTTATAAEKAALFNFVALRRLKG